MQRTLRATALTATATAMALSLALTGCGGDKSSSSGGGADKEKKAAVPKEGPAGSEVIEKVKKNLDSLKSVTITGSVDTDGTKMKVDANGSLEDDGEFSLTMKGVVDGKPNDVTIVRSGGKTYMKGSEDFYKANMGDSSGKMAKAIGSKYLEVPATQAKSMQNMTLKGLIDSMTKDAFSTDELKDPKAKGKLETFEGQQVYGYQTGDSDKTTLYMTADGSEQFAGMKSPSQGTIAFKDHNKQTSVKAPAKSEVMSMQDLQKAAMGG